MASSLSIARPRVPFAFTTRAFNFEREEDVPFELASFSISLSSSIFFRPIKRMEGGGKSVRRVLSILDERKAKNQIGPSSWPRTKTIARNGRILNDV